MYREYFEYRQSTMKNPYVLFSSVVELCSFLILAQTSLSKVCTFSGVSITVLISFQTPYAFFCVYFSHHLPLQTKSVMTNDYYAIHNNVLSPLDQVSLPFALIKAPLLNKLGKASKQRELIINTLDVLLDEQKCYARVLRSATSFYTVIASLEES